MELHTDQTYFAGFLSEAMVISSVITFTVIMLLFNDFSVFLHLADSELYLLPLSWIVYASG